MKWKELISVLAILGGFLVILFFIISIWNDLTNLRCISSTSEMIVFQTGPLKPLSVAMPGIWVLLLAFILLYSMRYEIKNRKNKKQSQNKANIKNISKLIGLFLVCCFSIFLIFVMFFYDIPNSISSEKIVISKYDQVIEIEKHYLLKDEEHIRISFDEIDHILYGYYSGIPNENPPYSEVEITKLDGMNIEIYSDEYESWEQQDLAKTIAEAAGKKLIEKEYR